MIGHKITIITPCYHNELNIAPYAEQMFANEKLFPKEVSFEYILVDDGSKDATWKALEAFREANPEKVKIIKLVRNAGSTNAVFAAMQHATGNCNVIISADLQDPPELIFKMYEHWKKGFKLVLANRTNREEPWLQTFISNTVHSAVQRWAVKNLPDGGFDMNLFDREVKEVILKMNEKNSYFPYLLMWLGYEYVNIPYTRRKRELGKSGYTLSKKIKIFIDSFVAFSFLPIRLISTIGLLLGFVAMIYGVFIVIAKFNGNIEVQGWTSMMLVFLIISSFQMIALGIIGEYLWRTLDQVRNRPNYIVEKEYI